MPRFFVNPDDPSPDDGSVPVDPVVPESPGVPSAPGGDAVIPGAGTPPVPEGTNPNRGRGGGDTGYNPGNGPVFNLPGAPVFRPPTFSRPSIEDAYNEPGYRFRSQAGSDALERSAAARGVLRTGGTLKDLVEYGQNFAAQEYGQVFNRALSAYDRQYQGARDAFAPTMARYNAQLSAEQQRAMALYQRQWEAYTFQHRNQGGGGGGNGIEPPPKPETWIPGATGPETGGGGAIEPRRGGPATSSRDPYDQYQWL